MHASIKHSVFPVFVVSILFQCASFAPQYFEYRGFNPLYQTTGDNGMTLKDAENSYDVRPENYNTASANTNTGNNQYNYQGNDFLSDSWLAVDALPNEGNFWPQVSNSLTPPVYAESQFSSVITEPDQPLRADDELTSQFQRGRSDIDPEEDEEEFGGYFYPKPKIPFDLPDFKTVSVATEEQSDSVVVSTTAKSEGTTEKATTTTTTPSSVESSTGPNGKV